ncbi:MAG TPA: DUF6624 domain-containing protein [Bryobacteraceae bacterium]|nr:DUF6624 domain-containing protein [Bryobacteraceae bacterium]
MLIPLPLLVVSLLFQPQVRDPELTARIQKLLHTVVTEHDRNREAGVDEAKEIFRQHGLPSVAAVGDEAAYDFVFLTCTTGSPAFRQEVAQKAREAAKKHELPEDAATYCTVHQRQESVKSNLQKQRPRNPALRDQIETLFKEDQAVRQREGFDFAKMLETDRAHAPVVEDLFAKCGVPGYRTVGPQAASHFALLIQHQSPDFRARVLPLLKANVDAGQADPESYAMIYDRSQTDTGKMQLYGENFVCDTEHPTMRPAPIHDPDHVNQRRAAIGLMRFEVYTKLLLETSPSLCGH